MKLEEAFQRSSRIVRVPSNAYWGEELEDDFRLPANFSTSNIINYIIYKRYASFLSLFFFFFSFFFFLVGSLTSC